MTAVVRITGYGVLSAAGVGGKALVEAVRGGGLPAAEGAGELLGEPAPAVRALPVPGFDATAYLGRKGVRTLSRTSALGMSACELALDTLPEPVPAQERADTGVVLGTGTGSAQAFADFFRDSYQQERPYLVSPALFPGILPNHCASQVAMRHSFTGVNASLAGGRISALSALRFARNALTTGQARRLLAGGVEELSPVSARAWSAAGGLGPGAALGEGGAVFVLEAAPDGPPAGTGPVVELVACEIGFRAPENGPAAIAAALAERIRRALARAATADGAAPPEVSVASVGAAAGRGWAAVETRGRRQALGVDSPTVLRVQEVLGETYSASAGLQLAALLAHWESSPEPAGPELGLVTSVDADGSVGCALLRRVPTA